MTEALPFASPQWQSGAWRRIVQAAGLVALTAALLVAVVPGMTTLVVFVLLTLWCHGPLSPLLPAAYEPVLLGYGRLFPPLALAITGAVVSTAIEYLNYHLYQRLLRVECLDRILRSPATRRLTQPFFRRPFLTVWLCVFTPLPDWGARVLASHSGYSVRRYLTAVLLARLPRFWLLAALGFHLHLGTGAVLAIAAASAVVTLIGLSRRQHGMASPKPALPSCVLLILGVLLAPIPLGRLEGQTAGRLSGRAMGVSMDRFMENGSGIIAMSYRFSDLRPGRLGTEIGVSTFPQTLFGRTLLLMPDVGAAYNISLPVGSLLLKGGGSAIAVLGPPGVFFAPGFHVGGALMVQTGSRSGLRIDVIRHYYWVDGREIQPVWSVGLGFAILSRKVPQT